MREVIATLPEGTDMRMNIYLTSPATGFEVVLGVTWRDKLPSLEGLPEGGIDLAKKLVGSLGPIESLADDWRLMSAAEVDDYKHRQEHGEPESEDDGEEL